MNIENTLLQMLFGAMAGYITNDLALEMLFEKRFGLGGVIPRTKQQFIGNISELVERDIITGTIIKEEMEKPEFDQAIGKAADDFFEVSLPKKIEDILLAKTPGFDQMAAYIAAYVDQKMDVIVELAISALDGQIQPDEIIREQDLQFAAERILDVFTQAIMEKPVIEDLIKEYAGEIKENRMEALLDWMMGFIDENRSQLEQMIGRAMTSGLSKMGPMMVMLAGGLSLMGGSIQAEAVNFIADRERIKNFLMDKLDEISRGESAISVEAKNAAVRLLQEEKDTMLDQMQRVMAAAIEGVNVRSAAELFLDRDMLRSLVRPETIKALAQTINLRSVYHHFIKGTDAAKQIKERAGEEAVHYVKQNAQQVLSGKVRQFVANHLERYDENEIKETARSFIGHNLKPISYFGGFLGMITGFFLSLAMPAGNAVSLSATLIYMATYGVMGWATNWIAILMLFRPYRKYAVIPFFSPGYIMKNKTAFGLSLGMFIETEVLSGKIISAWFRGGKETIRDKLSEKITSEDYEAIRNLLTANRDVMAEHIATWEMKWLHENKGEVAAQLTALLGGLPVKSMITSHEKQLAERLWNELHSEKNAAMVCQAAEVMLNRIVARGFDEMDRPENKKKMADYLCKNIAVLGAIPFVPQPMVHQILVHVIEALITEELPIFWAERSTQIQKAVIGGIDIGMIEQTVVYGKNNLDNQKVGDYLVEKKIRHNLEKQIERMSESEGLLQHEIRSGNMILGDIAAAETFLMGDELLQYGVGIFAGGIVDAMERNIGGVLRSVSFAEVTQDQVMKLDGREIHKMFDSFMHKYFVSIRRYGFIGAAFGIHTIAGLGLMAAYWLWALVRRFKIKK